MHAEDAYYCLLAIVIINIIAYVHFAGKYDTLEKRVDQLENASNQTKSQQ